MPAHRGEAFHEIVLVGVRSIVRPSVSSSWGLRLLRARHDLVADEGAEMVRVRVGGVLSPEVPLRIACAYLAGLLSFAQVIAQVFAPNVKKRTRDGTVLVAHRSESRQGPVPTIERI